MNKNKINQKIKNLTVLVSCFLMVFFTGCKEEGRIDHVDDGAPAPEQVTDVTVRNTPGGAVVKYKLPKDKNLLSVRAVYEIRPGVVREGESSYFKDSLILEGFGDTRTYDVKLYSVGKNEKLSEPYTVQVTPETAPVRVAKKELKETFSGVSISIENPHKVNLAIVLMGDTAQIGYQSILHTFYTSLEKATFTFRGLDTIPGDYSVYLRDRWYNLSDTVEATLKPLYEIIIPWNTWQEYSLEGDAVELIGAQYFIRNIWNGDRTNIGATYYSDVLPLPQIITWDLGRTIIMSRLKVWPRNTPSDLWVRAHVRVFELYGSVDPNPDGSLDESWIPLGRFEAVKPSPGETITQEDIDFALQGFEYDLEVNEFAPDPFVPVRYIRFRTISTFGSVAASSVCIQEINFWGKFVDE